MVKRAKHNPNGKVGHFNGTDMQKGDGGSNDRAPSFGFKSDSMSQSVSQRLSPVIDNVIDTDDREENGVSSDSTVGSSPGGGVNGYDHAAGTFTSPTPPSTGKRRRSEDSSTPSAQPHTRPCLRREQGGRAWPWTWDRREEDRARLTVKGFNEGKIQLNVMSQPKKEIPTLLSLEKLPPKDAYPYYQYRGSITLGSASDTARYTPLKILSSILSSATV